MITFSENLDFVLTVVHPSCELGVFGCMNSMRCSTRCDRR
jgi:hypothetical protein